MKKLRKSLAVLLAIIMLASFTPLFASAATAASKTNCVIVEYPQFSYTDPTTNETVTTDATNTNITVPYGTTYDEINFVGGKITYNDTVVEGYFDWASAYLTRTPDVGVQTSYRLYFYPTDTTTYSRGTWRVTDITGWPTITVNGLDGTLVEAPTAADILTGQPLSAATLTGGVVNDADGNAVTGTWSYVYPTSYPTASGKYEVQFIATGYNALKTTVDVTVTSNGNATATEVPTIKRMILGDTLNKAKLSGGKVVDDNGVEITTGTWSVVNDATQDTSAKLETLGNVTCKVQWVALGYPVITKEVTFLVAENIGYTVDKPTLETPVTYVTGLTNATLPFVYGNASVPGKYSVTNPDTSLTNKNKTYSTTLTFTPDDTTLDSTSWTYSFKIKANDIWYTQPEEPLKIVVPYGHSSNTVSKGTAVSWPDVLTEMGVNDFWWNKNNYDIASMDVGEIQLVTGVVRSGGKTNYENISASFYIQAEPTTIEGEYGSFINMLVVDKITAKAVFKFTCKCPGITGTVTIRQGDTVLATLTPDENGYISEYVYFTPKVDGTYFFTATYTPGLMDKVTIADPVITSDTIDLDIKTEMTIYVYDASGRDSISTGICGEVARVSFQDSGYKAEELEYWEVLDQNGNAVTLYDENSNKVSLTSPAFSFILPDDASITELHFYPHGPWDDEIIISGNDDMGTTLVKLWQKLTNWLVELYRTIVELLIPTVETF